MVEVQASGRSRARQLTETAAVAARNGDCARVRVVQEEVLELDGEIYRDAFLGDAYVSACVPLEARGASAGTPGRAGAASERSGPVFGGALAFGAIAQLDGQLGWMVTPRLALFATAAIGAIVNAEDGGSYRMWGAGARVWPAPQVFLDGRIGRIEEEYAGFEDHPPVRRAGAGVQLEAGVEAGNSVAGLDLHLGVLIGAGPASVFLALGVAMY